jgi:hypothetical protein
MNPEQEDFRALRQLLVLKRYEQPPPGYFNNFSAKIIARIESGEMAAAENPSWAVRLWQFFENKPLFAGAFGMFVCGLVVSGVAYSDSGSAVAVKNLSDSGGLASNLPTDQAATVSVAEPAATEPPLLTTASYSPSVGVSVPQPSLFEEIRNQQSPRAFLANFK